ncbi:MAG: ankyrin repeat domain-containing protein [Candidatus Eremiobacterota bacterium]
MKYLLSIIFILLLSIRSYAGTGDLSPRQDNAPDKPAVVDSSGRRVENSSDIESFSEKKSEILEKKSPEKISEKISEKNTEILEEKSPDKISDVTEERKSSEKISGVDRRLNISDNEEIKNQDLNNTYNEEIKNQDFSNYNTYNVTPDIPGYWDTRGDSFFSDRRYAEAIECYAEALKINPSSKELDDKIEEAKILFDNLGVYFKNSEGTTLLHSRVNNFSDVKALVYNGADINATNIYGDTPLHLLTGFKDYNPDRLETVRFLIEHGASVNAQDREGNTPLHKAAENGFYSVVEFLIKKGARIDARNFYGYTPLDLAIIWDREDTAKLLMKYGAR